MPLADLPITNRQRFLTLSSLVEGLKYKVTGNKMSITSDDSLFAAGFVRGTLLEIATYCRLTVAPIAD